VGAALLGPGFDPEVKQKLTDSKKLSARRRDELSGIILRQAAATGLGWVSAAEIDRYGLGPSLKLAARRAAKAVLALCKAKNLKFDEIVIDGTINLLADTPLEGRVTILKKADFLIKEVSAASIIAKVARDRYMCGLAEKYPGYGFEKHVGYGTAAHQEALRTLGPCPEHRRSFRPIQELAHTEMTSSAQSMPNHPRTPSVTTTELGQTAEGVIADYLTSQGHQLLARNFKTKTCEIDLVTVLGQELYFTEVKYRKSTNHGTALAQITPKKQAQMRYAATVFLAQHPELANYATFLAAAAVAGPNFQPEGWFPLAE